MVWVFRACLGLAIVAYAGWLIWPAAQPVTTGADLASVGAAVMAEARSAGWDVTGLWLGAAGLYLVAGGLTAAGVAVAPGAYFLAFGAEVLLRLSLIGRDAATLADVPAHAAAALAPLNLAVDPGPLSLGALLAVGLLVLALGLWRGQKGQALTRDWTRPPVYA